MFKVSIFFNVVLIVALIISGIFYMDLKTQNDATLQQLSFVTKRWEASVNWFEAAVEELQATKQDYLRLQEICSPQVEKLTGWVGLEK